MCHLYGYNRQLLEAYCVGYILESEGGVSGLLQLEMLEEIRIIGNGTELIDPEVT
jgi:CMP-2-keto-3-deoxyoctulosonic acid synthetase